MPTKKDLAGLPDDEPSKAPLRRGRGLRLSTETPKQSATARRKAGAAQADPAPKEAAAMRPAARRKPAPATPKAAITTAESDPLEATLAALADATPIDSVDRAAEPQEPERRKREFRLRRDLLKACKRIAQSQNRKLTEVIEAALKEYIQRHEAAA